jgi:hypothetical protein
MPVLIKLILTFASPIQFNQKKLEIPSVASWRIRGHDDSTGSTGTTHRSHLITDTRCHINDGPSLATNITRTNKLFISVTCHTVTATHFNGPATNPKAVPRPIHVFPARIASVGE